MRLRCWDPRDAPLLEDALHSSLDHLRPWLPWAHAEPTTRDEKVDRLRRFRAMFDLGEDFVYGIFTPDESEVVGGTGLHPRVGDGALEIGYWLRASRVGCGFAREAAAALTTVAFRVCDVDRVEIRVDPANEASLRIPRSLGFREEAVLRRRLPTREGQPLRDVVVFSLFAEQLAGSPVSAVRVEAYDVLGRALPV